MLSSFSGWFEFPWSRRRKLEENCDSNHQQNSTGSSSSAAIPSTSHQHPSNWTFGETNLDRPPPAKRSKTSQWGRKLTELWVTRGVVSRGKLSRPSYHSPRNSPSHRPPFHSTVRRTPASVFPSLSNSSNLENNRVQNGLLTMLGMGGDSRGRESAGSSRIPVVDLTEDNEEDDIFLVGEANEWTDDEEVGSGEFVQRISPLNSLEPLQQHSPTLSNGPQASSSSDRSLTRTKIRPSPKSGLDGRYSNAIDPRFPNWSNMTSKGIDLNSRDRYRRLLTECEPESYRSSSTSSLPSRPLDSKTTRKSFGADTFQTCMEDVRKVLNEMVAPTASSHSAPDVLENGGEDVDVEIIGEVRRRSSGGFFLSPESQRLSRKFEEDPFFVTEKINKEYKPASQSRKKEAERLELEIAMRREQREKLLRTEEEDIRLRMRLEGLILLEDFEEEEEAVPDEFPELTEEQERAVAKALGPGAASQVLVDHFNIRIHRKDIKTLDGLNWLNDEIIFFYLNLVMERGGKGGLPSVYSFNTFFYPKLMQGGHAALKRWTRKVDIFAFDLLLVPVHLKAHWCLAVVDFRKKRIDYFDSMGGANQRCLEELEKYLQAEHMDKKKTKLETEDWQKICRSDIPRQMNGSDCGMFACKFSDYMARDAKITFSQEHMSYFRRRMVFEILNKQLL